MKCISSGLVLIFFGKYHFNKKKIQRIVIPEINLVIDLLKRAQKCLVADSEKTFASPTATALSTSAILLEWKEYEEGSVPVTYTITWMPTEQYDKPLSLNQNSIVTLHDCFYPIDAKSGSGDGPNENNITGITNTSFVVKHLNSNTEYSFTVAIVGEAGFEITSNTTICPTGNNFF